VNETERHADRSPRVAHLLIDPGEQERALLFIGHYGSHAQPDHGKRDETDEQTCS
jgi:hypothetical protein